MKNKIAQLIERLGISAYRFADQTGVSRNTVYALKNNPDQFPSSDVFDRIISAYNVSPSDIVEWVSDPSIDK